MQQLFACYARLVGECKLTIGGRDLPQRPDMAEQVDDLQAGLAIVGVAPERAALNAATGVCANFDRSSASIWQNATAPP
jgi:hypothetical protein